MMFMLGFAAGVIVGVAATLAITSALDQDQMAAATTTQPGIAGPATPGPGTPTTGTAPQQAPTGPTTPQDPAPREPVPGTAPDASTPIPQ